MPIATQTVWDATVALPWEYLLRIVVATVLGGVVGAERQRRGAVAGFRTLILVSVGAALAMVVSLHFADVFGRVAATDSLRISPSRLATGVMGGIGFLGAGAIIRYRTGVRGLTTAASLWCTASIGLACGFGMYFVATGATLVVLGTLLALSPLDEKIPSLTQRIVTAVQDCDTARGTDAVEAVFAERGVKVVSRLYDRNVEDNTEKIRLEIRIPSGLRLTELYRALDALPGMKHYSFK